MAAKPQSDKLPFEVFQAIEDASPKKRAELLESLGSNFTIQTILQANFSPGIELEVPEGEPPYTPSDAPAGMEKSRIQNVIRPLGLLIKKNKSVAPYKKEAMFITMLEGVHEKDAKILIAMKDKKLTELYPSITAKLVSSVWPTLIISK